MTTRVETPQSRCHIGFTRADITPPVGIYHRMWGAALHDCASGVHRPLTATAMCLTSLDRSSRQLILGIDHCILDRDIFDRIRMAIESKLSITPGDVQICLSHTHGSAWMSRSRSHLPGGKLIEPYLEHLIKVCSWAAAGAAAQTMGDTEPVTLVYGTARCSLAAHRDYHDVTTKQYVCGFNPDGPADDTVLVAKAVADNGRMIGTIVNFACHPTTLAWENTLISPDYVGAMREVVEQHTGAPCLFLQGASGDLGPREGYVGDVAVADRNGRQLGFAALSGLEALSPPGTHFEYAGPVVSGAVLGTWKHQPSPRNFAGWQAHEFTVPLPYRLELPTPEATRSELAKWEAEEAAARAANDTACVSECRAKAEQMTRQLVRLAALPEGRAYPLCVSVLRLGQALWVFVPGELYQHFQVALRARFPRFAVIVSTVTNDWQPGYIPAVSSYGYGIYQDVIAAVAPGCLEALTETVGREIERIITS